MAAPVIDPKPELKSLRGIITDVQFGFVPIMHNDKCLPLPFQYVFIQERDGLAHLLLHPGNRAWWKGKDVRVEYTPAQGGKVAEYELFEDIRLYYSEWSHSLITCEHVFTAGPSGIEAEGIIKNLEYAIVLGSSRP